MSFEFQFSLEVLNHLGRGLYRNFSTVIAEAVSNSWDANATEVHINIDKKKKEMTITDNGEGMNEEDFKGKFLKIGYSRRGEKRNQSSRKVFGRKGIGKLALLSVADIITINSKKQGNREIGGIINNRDLDQKIEEDSKYLLEDPANLKTISGEEGTCLKFEAIKPSVSDPDKIKKYLAILFNFSFSHSSEQFDIYVNEKKISKKDLSELHNNTQCIWNLGDQSNSHINAKSHTLEAKSFTSDDRKHIIKGYIASVFKPSHLKIHGADFRAGLHLFVNGRLRQENIFKDIRSDRIVESYLYGEIHVDAFDEGDDIFTSSREGVIKDNPRYTAFLTELKKIQSKVIGDWDSFRCDKQIKSINTSELLKDLRKDKKEAIKKFLSCKEDGNLQEKSRNQFLREIIPKNCKKKILICHASADKNLADKVEGKLLNIGLTSSDIIYSNSAHQESRLPVEDMLNYIKDFFIQDWIDNPAVIFVVSSNMENSWFASLEAGAAWVTTAKQHLTVANNFRPQSPLNLNNLYLKFDENGDFKNEQNVEQFFNNIKNKYLK